MAGIRLTNDLQDLEKEMPEAYAQFENIARQLEKHYREMQDVEFTIEKGKLWMLQTRDGKRTAQAAVRIAVDMAEEGLISRKEAVLRVTPEQVDFFLHPQFESQRHQSRQGRRQTAGQGAECFTRRRARSGRTRSRPGRIVGQGKESQVIMVRPETKPDDVHGMLAAEGILTSRGGRTSHAALVARQFGKPAVVGVDAMKIDMNSRCLVIGNNEHRRGRLDLHRRHGR